jgi:hypothetical protein
LLKLRRSSLGSCGIGNASMGQPLGAALGVGLALAAENANLSGTVVASGPERAAVLAAGPPSSRPPSPEEPSRDPGKSKDKEKDKERAKASSRTLPAGARFLQLCGQLNAQGDVIRGFVPTCRLQIVFAAVTVHEEAGSA